MSRREGGYVDLRDYAAIGDGRTVALIALDGSVDWLPIPALDSPPVFGRLLDAERGGCFTLEPVVPYDVTRRYLPGSNVLESTFTTPDGVVRVTDALVTGVAGRLPWSELARRVEGVSGSVRLRWAVEPGTVFDTSSPWVERTALGDVIRDDGVMLAVRGIDHRPRRTDRGIRGTITTSTGSRALVTIVGTAGEPIHLPEPEKTDVGVDRTVENWAAWSREFSYDGGWADAVQRSALALKLLIYAPSGAIAAAATTSLPESLEGHKRWDYRFAWVRDTAYTLTVLTRFGLREETHAAISWLLRTIRENGLHIFYRLDGTVAGDEVQEFAVPGWRDSGPVSVGNPAAGQRQLGIYGDLFQLVRRYVEAGNLLDADTSRLLSRLADEVCDVWRMPDSGMWELPEERQWTASRMGCWSALDNAVRLAELDQIPGDAARWTAERDTIAAWVAENCWSDDRQAYVAHPETDDLDTTVLLHAPSGFDRGGRMSSTIDAIREELGRDDLVYRYSGAEAEEGAFVACGFWLASALACIGRMDEAIEQMDASVARINDVGLLAEMIDPDSGAFLGNLPQGLSHLALVNAAITIDELRRTGSTRERA